MSILKNKLEQDKKSGIYENAWKETRKHPLKLLKDPLYRTHSKEVDMILSVVEEFNIFIDCGVGTAASESWSIKDKIPNCEIIGFEAMKERYELLENIYPGTLYYQCISNKIGSINGFTGFPTGNCSFELHATEEYIEVELYKKCIIESTTIDKLLKDKKEKVLVWADIEGSEPDMLFGSLQSIKNNKIIGFFLETSPKTQSYIDKILLPFGFKKQQYRECGTHADWLYYK